MTIQTSNGDTPPNSRPPALDGTAQAALYLAAFAWPWAVFELLPVVFVPLSVSSAMVLAVCTPLDVLSGTRFRVPFEFIWPIVGLALVACIGQSPANALASALACVAFLTTLHWVRSRGIAAWAMILSCISGAGAALLTWAAQPGWVLPTTFSLSGGIPLAFAQSMPRGLLTLLLCTGAATTLGWRNSGGVPLRRLSRNSKLQTQILKWGARAAALFCALTAMAAAYPLACAFAEGLETTPGTSSGFPHLVLVVLFFWLLARIAAKAIAGWLEDTQDGQLGVCATILLAAAGMLLAPVQPGIGHAMFLAILAGYVIPRERPEAVKPFAFYWLAPVVLLVAWNVFHVSPANPRDPRNYEASAFKALHAGQGEELGAYLDRLDQLVPGERRTHWWRARIRLNREDLEGAAEAFRTALQPGQPRMLPPPTPTEREWFLSSLRDRVSALPPGERGLSYEKTLLALGERKSALASLKLRSKGAASAPIDTRALANILAGLLGALDTEEELTTWEPGELLGVLKSLGADVERAPEGFPASSLPLVLIAEHSSHGMRIEGIAGRHRFGGVCLSSGRPAQGPPAETLPAWGPLHLTDGAWQCTFGEFAEIALGPSPFVYLTDTITPAGGTAPRTQVRIRVP